MDSVHKPAVQAVTILMSNQIIVYLTVVYYKREMLMFECRFLVLCNVRFTLVECAKLRQHQ